MVSDAELLSPGRRGAGAVTAAQLGQPGDCHGPRRWGASYRAPWTGVPWYLPTVMQTSGNSASVPEDTKRPVSVKQKLKKEKQTSIKCKLSYVCFGPRGAEVIRMTADSRHLTPSFSSWTDAELQELLEPKVNHRKGSVSSSQEQICVRNLMTCSWIDRKNHFPK